MSLAMTSYRQLQNDDVSDTFDAELDTHSDSFPHHEEVEVQIEPRQARTKSHLRLPNTHCTKNKVILVLVIMILILVLIAALTIYEVDKHGTMCHSDEKTQSEATTTTQAPPTTTPSPTSTVATTPLATQATATNGEPFPWTDVRLPTSVRPIKYEISLHPNLTTFDVHGNVTILFKTAEDVNFVVMHAKEMSITMPEKVLVDRKETVGVEKLLMYTRNEQIYIGFGKTIRAGGHCSVTLHFNYTLKDSLDGFYRSTYTVDGQKRNIAVTQFESTFARKAFPCFDEPGMKARFSLKILRTRDYMTLFNMPALQRGVAYDPDPDLVQDIYNTTVPMSTYLVAFVVCDFVKINDTTSNGTQVSVYAPEGQISQAALALEVLNKTIPFYEEFFNIRYPLPKQDMIAIPDFSAGAMENWGLITYRESSVLFKPNVTSSHQETWIVITITHELAHQWFGNLVTMRWWNDLWLNEGFATFVEYIGANHFKPEWHMMDKFILDTTHVAMGHDGLGYSHPISIPVSNPDEIGELFDQISYSKGATILKMLQSYLQKGDQDVMLKGLQAYLKKYAYSNTATSDLWNCIAEAANNATSGPTSQEVNITQMMDTWTLQMGFPMVNLTWLGGTVTATQQRFLMYPQGEPSDEFDSPYGYKWTIPLTYITQSDTVNVLTTVMNSNQDDMTFTVPASNRWFKANVNQSGMYRVNYDTKTWTALIKQLQDDHTVFTPADRASLIDDAFHLAWAGVIDQSVALNMSLYLAKECDYVPIETALGMLDMIGSVLYSREGYTYYKDYVLTLFSLLQSNLGYTDSGTYLERLLRASLLDSFQRLGHTPTLEWASREYKKWMENNATDVGVNLHEIIRCGGMQYGHEEEWNFAWRQYMTTTSATEKRSLQYALSCTQDPALLNKYLYWSLDGTKIRLQDATSVISAIAGQPAGSYMAFSFLIQNWDILKEKIGSQPFTMTYLISGTTGWISTEFEYAIAKQFFDKHKDDAKEGKRALRQSLEGMRMRIAWLQNHETRVTDWLKWAVGHLQSLSAASNRLQCYR